MTRVLSCNHYRVWKGFHSISLCGHKQEFSPWEVPVLSLPKSFLERLGTPTPITLREVARVPHERRSKWLELAEVLSSRLPTQSTKCTSDYLSCLATDELPNHRWASQCPWIITAFHLDGMPSALRQLLPAMHFRATLSWFAKVSHPGQINSPQFLHFRSTRFRPEHDPQAFVIQQS